MGAVQVQYMSTKVTIEFPPTNSTKKRKAAFHKLAEDVAMDEAVEVEVEVADAADEDEDEDEDVVEDATEMTWSIMAWMFLTTPVHSLTMR